MARAHPQGAEYQFVRVLKWARGVEWGVGRGVMELVRQGKFLHFSIATRAEI